MEIRKTSKLSEDDRAQIAREVDRTDSYKKAAKKIYISTEDGQKFRISKDTAEEIYEKEYGRRTNEARASYEKSIADKQEPKSDRLLDLETIKNIGILYSKRLSIGQIKQSMELDHKVILDDKDITEAIKAYNHKNREEGS